MAEEFIIPSIFNGNSADEIEERMLARLPEDIDKTPGGFVWDFTMPTAIEKDDIINYYLVRTLQLMFPDWAWGDWLDLHGARRDVLVYRKEANRASGKVTITGVPGTILPKGFLVCTPASGNNSSIMYELDEEATIPDTGVIEVPITATDGGIRSNVAAGTITIMASPIVGIRSISNAADVTGGTETETDDDYRERILEALRTKGTSFIGNDADYIRWAKEVNGIGTCIVVSGNDFKGPGTVKLALVDSNGKPANEKLCKAVYDHIISPDDRMQRLLPTGSSLLVCEPATTITIDFTCTDLELENDMTLEKLVENYKDALHRYFEIAKDEQKEVRYTMAYAILAELPGVVNFENFQINAQEDSIKLLIDQYPEIGKVDLKLLGEG